MRRKMKQQRARAALLALTLGLVPGGVGDAAAAPSASATASFPAFGTPAFGPLVQDSREATGAANLPDFGTWWAAAYARTPAARLPGHPELSWAGAVRLRRGELAAARDPARRARLERDTAAWLHRAVKAVIPKFSLDRGFEFAHAVRLGERQCLLQSVLIAGMLREMGAEAGTAMVWKNERGQESNLGHVVTVLRLTGGGDLLVDASDPTPFMRHGGLLLRVGGGYRFVEPRYDAQSRITGYAAGGGALTPAQVQPLDPAYVRSQFDYYRGERVPGGFIGPSTPAGLSASARYLERALQRQPGNPLAAYVLGHVYRKQARLADARRQYERAFRLYRAAGHVPERVTEALAWAKGEQANGKAGKP